MNDDKKLSEQIDEVIKIFSDISNDYYNSINMERELFNTRMDMIHALELDESLKYHQIAHLGIDIRDISRTRRKYKNGYLIREPVVQFLKAHPTIISDLSKLKCELIKIEGYIDNMHYNYRQKVQDIQNISEDTPITLKNKEDLVSINHAISKNVNRYESEITSYGTSESPCEILIKLWSVDHFSTNIAGLKSFTASIYKNIDRYFTNQNDNITTSLITSDMLAINDDDNKELNSKITVIINDDEIYDIHCKTYGIKSSDNETSNKKSSKNKKHSKKRR